MKADANELVTAEAKRLENAEPCSVRAYFLHELLWHARPMSFTIILHPTEHVNPPLPILPAERYVAYGLSFRVLYDDGGQYRFTRLAVRFSCPF